MLVRPGYSYWTLHYLTSLRGVKKLLSHQPFQNISPICTHSKELGCVREREREREKDRGGKEKSECGGREEKWRVWIAAEL